MSEKRPTFYVIDDNVHTYRSPVLKIAYIDGGEILSPREGQQILPSDIAVMVGNGCHVYIYPNGSEQRMKKEREARRG